MSGRFWDLVVLRDPTNRGDHVSHGLVSIARTFVEGFHHHFVRCGGNAAVGRTFTGWRYLLVLDVVERFIDVRTAERFADRQYLIQCDSGAEDVGAFIDASIAIRFVRATCTAVCRVVVHRRSKSAFVRRHRDGDSSARFVESARCHRHVPKLWRHPSPIK